MHAVWVNGFAHLSYPMLWCRIDIWKCYMLCRFTFHISNLNVCIWQSAKIYSQISRQIQKKGAHCAKWRMWKKSRQNQYGNRNRLGFWEFPVFILIDCLNRVDLFLLFPLVRMKIQLTKWLRWQPQELFLWHTFPPSNCLLLLLLLLPFFGVFRSLLSLPYHMEYNEMSMTIIRAL